MEITNETVRVPFMVGTLPGWWLGREDGRTQSPTITEVQWDSVLRRCQFSGTDSILRDTDDQLNQTVSVMISQAINPSVSRLRDPLAEANGELPIQDLTIIGNFSPLVTQTAHSIRQYLLPFASNILILNNLEDVVDRSILPGSSVLCICDLEEPCFQQMGSRKFHAAKTIFKNARHIIWASSGCQAANPHANPYASMIIGLGRSAIMEYPHVRLQTLDFEVWHPSNSKMLAEMFLRLVYLGLPAFHDIMWSVENELIITKDSIHIPRIIPDDALNRRFNSSRREIEYPVSLENNPIEISYKGDSLYLREKSPLLPPPHQRNDEYITVKVQYSTMAPMLSSDNHRFFVCIGFSVPSGQKAIVLSPINASLITVPQEDMINLDWTGDDASNLRELLLVLLCESISHGVTETLWVHNADEDIQEVLRVISLSSGINLFLSTSSQSSKGGSVFIHERTPTRNLQPLVPPKVERFVDMTFRNSVCLSNLMEAAVRSGADAHCPFVTSNEEFSMSLLSSRRESWAIMQSAARSLRVAAKAQYIAQPISVDAISQSLVSQHHLTIIDWASVNTVSVQATPLNAHELFSSSKTYLLIGLTGDVGMSLCEWMVNHGAKYLAVASRSPKINREVIEYLQSKGAVLQVFAFDIADKAALDRAHKEIVSTMPPIAGVANAAMVLKDKTLDNMSLQDFEDVLRPKVEGSQNLDDLFYATELDFFILFSSMSSVVGNPAQSNYGAANMFMLSLAARRRRRGLSASVIDIAMLLGVGYVARSLTSTNSVIESQMSRFAYLALSETDFHAIFAEAIFTGKSDLGSDPELMTGLGAHSNAPWRSVSRFSHYLTSVMNGDPSAENRLAGSESQNNSIHQVSSRVSKTDNDEDAIKVLRAALVAKLGFALQESHENIDQKTPLVAMGIDSLIAVEIRSWLLKELGVDVPVFQILSGWSVEEICRDSMAKFRHLQEDEKERVKTNNDSEPHELSFHDSPGEIAPAQPLSHSDTIPIATHKDQTGSDTILAYQRTGEMSEAQARLFFLHDFLRNKTNYNVGYIGKIAGEICVTKLSRALQAVGLKHEGLRTSFYIEQSTGKATQAVNREPCITLEHKTISSQDDLKKETELLRHYVFDIEKADTVKVVVLSYTESLHHIIILHHHIALDGLEFWTEMYKTPVDHLPLFGFSKSPARQLLTAYDTETIDIELAPELVRSVRQTASKLGVTAFHFYLTSLAVMLAHCLDARDFSIGIVDANRPDQEDLQTIGHFLNMLPLRFHLDPQQSFQDLARKSRDLTLGALSNSLSFNTILDHLRVQRAGNVHPLFQVALNYRVGFSATSPLGKGVIEWTGGINAKNPYDLMIDITETGRKTIVSLTSQNYLYGAEDSRFIMKWYMRSIEGLARAPSTYVGNCPFYNQQDVDTALSKGLGKSMELDWGGTIVDRIESMAHKYSDIIAVKDGHGHSITYAQMMVRSGCIANSLRSHPIKTGSYVAMLLEPTIDAICCLLAVLRLGLVWVPLDTAHPQPRLSAMVADCLPCAIVCSNATHLTASQIAMSTTRVLDLDKPISAVSEVENNSQRAKPAVLLYTSGSTGKPKGVQVTHFNILNHVFGNTSTYGIGREVVLQQSSFGFDICLDQIFTAIANGGTLIVVGKEGRGDPTHIAHLISSERVTYTNFVPSEYLSLLHYSSSTLSSCKSWRYAVALGEKVGPQLRRGFRDLGLGTSLVFVNAYGPTEATISCARGRVSYINEEDVVTQRDSLWPLPNYSLIITNTQGKPLPSGFPGEICILGDGVSLGYLNRPEENNNQFFEPPFNVHQGGQPGAAVAYRTGDRGRLLEDGSLQVLGRFEGDSQVKIHGIRVELDEIANVIIQMAPTAILNVAVSYRKASDLLVAFVVFQKQFDGNPSELIEQLKHNVPLPPYMCPAVIMQVAQLPLNVNGKQDRTAIDNLPVSGPSQTTPSSAECSTSLERQLKKIWQDVLAALPGKPQNITTSSDFWKLGGNSMSALKLRASLQTCFGIKFTLPELFQMTDLHTMASNIELKRPGHTQDIDWDAEVAALCHNLPQPQIPFPDFPVSKGIVVLTGATGFLGTHILRRLVSDERVKEVHCVAIRHDSEGNPRHVSVKDKKIIEYSGDLSDHFLGLPNSSFQFLAENADLIIHNGAHVSFLRTYQSLRSVNVLSTRAILELAIPRGIPLHFISTASVATVSGESRPLHEVSVSRKRPKFSANNGYGESKWVSESLLERAALNQRARIWIHRLSSVIGDGAPQLDIMAALFHHSSLMRAVPIFDSGRLEGAFDVVEVEQVSAALAQTALASACLVEQPTGIRYLHHCGDKKILPEELKYYLEEREGVSFAQISLYQWLETAVKNGLSRTIYEFLSDAKDSEQKILLPVLAKSTKESFELPVET
ncbi:hypothetical protein GQX73_g6858 [Xylaria multiplex]|uniref:Carrier domain-containing protein n=1 Tax=Xylaria multiplex TaxID=323545 RepID=A0A7C8IS11_9PEZI|nr:hypothetical protein GQX73_g6858 [Xylaria multiplex]